MKQYLFLLLLVPALAFAEPMYSPTWGFRLDLPEGYEYVKGDGKSQFSFDGPAGLSFDIVVYKGGDYGSVKELVNDANRKLGNTGDIDFFDYNGKQAAIIELNFTNSTGYGLCVELAGNSAAKPMLLALSYVPASEKSFDIFHFSALDSVIPSEAEQRYPGPVMEYIYPRGKKTQVSLGASGIKAMIYENDAEAAQDFIEREYQILTSYVQSDVWCEAWIRYYRMVYRDSCDRISDAASALVKNWSGGKTGNDAKMALAKKALEFVQGFKYERHPEGSDFINLVTAVTEGRGDCDSRAMLWAVILANADIRAAIMVSQQHSHAMGLADLPGTGARFEAYGTKWLVAETTDKVDIGLIAQDVSNVEAWLGVVFE